MKGLLWGFILLLILIGIVVAGVRYDREDGRFSRLPLPQVDEVLDRETGLVWMSCPVGMGLALSGGRASCMGTALRFEWQQAQARAQSFARERGKPWRMPTAAELLSIVDDRRAGYALDPEAFPPFDWDEDGTAIALDVERGFWTSSRARQHEDDGAVWHVDAVRGSAAAWWGQRAKYGLRLVRDP